MKTLPSLETISISQYQYTVITLVCMLAFASVYRVLKFLYRTNFHCGDTANFFVCYTAAPEPTLFNCRHCTKTEVFN